MGVVLVGWFVVFVESFDYVKRVACSRSFTIPEYQEERKRGGATEQDSERVHSNKTSVINADCSSTDLGTAIATLSLKDLAIPRNRRYPVTRF